MLDRPREDVDLFAEPRPRAEHPAAVAAVVAAYHAEGFDVVRIDHRTRTFTRLYVTDGTPTDEMPVDALPRDRAHRVELVAKRRREPPVQLEIGPVLHADDVVAGKTHALYKRAAARDFLDVDAVLTSGRYGLDQLCALVGAAEPGFDRMTFADGLRRIDRFDDGEFTGYGCAAPAVAALRARVARWRAELLRRAA